MSDEDQHGPNLSGVEPTRRELVRRRVAALEEYEALPNRDWKDMVRLCTDLDVSPVTFYALWRAWRAHRDPARLQGVAAKRRPASRVMGDELMVRETLARVGRGGTIEADVLAVEEAAAVDGAKVRSRSALRRLIRDIREEGRDPPLRTTSPSMIALDFVPLEIPVSLPGGETLPLAALVLHPASATVLAGRLSLGAPDPRAAAAVLLKWVENLPPPGAGAVEIDHLLAPSDGDEGWTELFREVGRRGVPREGPTADRVPAGQIVLDTLRRDVLGLAIRPRMVHREAAERRPLVRTRRLNAPLSLEQGQTALDERIDA